jgi:hypothetical protein
MTLHFPNEEILIRRASGDHHVMGNIEVSAHATDASFSHEFGLEVVAEVEFTWDYFQPLPGAVGWLPGDIDYIKPALDEWMEANMEKLNKAFDNACKA